MEILLLVGRVLFGAFFVMSGFNHFANLKMMSGYAGYKGIPAPSAAVIGTGVILVAGGLSVVLGVLPVAGLLLLTLFLVVSAVTMHDFWKVEDAQARAAEQVNFLKNIALAGAALALLYGASSWGLTIA